MVIREALDFINDYELRQAEMGSMAISRLGPWVAVGAGAKKVPAPREFNPFSEIFYRREARETIATSTARTIRALHDEGKIPAWVVGVIDLELIKAAAE